MNTTYGGSVKVILYVYIYIYIYSYILNNALMVCTEVGSVISTVTHRADEIIEYPSGNHVGKSRAHVTNCTKRRKYSGCIMDWLS